MYLHSWNIFSREGICGVTYEKTCFTHRSEKGNIKNTYDISAAIKPILNIKPYSFMFNEHIRLEIIIQLCGTINVLSN